MKAKDIMTKRVVTVSPDENVLKVIKLFVKHKISGVPVVKNNKPVGIVTESDIIRSLNVFENKIVFTNSPLFVLIAAGVKYKNKSKQLEKEMKALEGLKVKDVMTKNPIAVTQEADLFDVIKVMSKNNINRVLVVDSKKKLKGIIAREDIIRALA